MLRVFIALAALSFLLSGEWTNARTIQPCNVLHLLDQYPVKQSASRIKFENPTILLDRINQANLAIRNNILSGVSITRDIGQIEHYGNAIAQQLKNSIELKTHSSTKLSADQILAIKVQLKALIKQFDCGNTPSLVQNSHRPIALSSEARSGIENTVHLYSPGILLASLSAFICIIGLPIWYKRSQTFKIAAHQRGCHTRALITYANNCTVTYVSNISHLDAKLEAPINHIHTNNVELYLAGHRIKAKKAWLNDHFLGVVFNNPISDQTLKDIVEACLDVDQLSRIGENATSCFSPGCHLDCRRHRPTRCSIEHAREYS